MSLLAWLRGDAPPDPVLPRDRGREQRDVLAAAAVALAEPGAEKDVDPVLRVTVGAARGITDAGAVLILVDGHGRVERLVGEGVDGCTRDTLARPDVVGALVDGVGTIGGPLGADDLEPATASALRAIAPRGLVVLPVGPAALLVVVDLETGEEIAADTFAVLSVLARLAASALDRVRRSAALNARCDELRRLCTDVLARQDEEAGRTAHEVHDGICQRLAAANAQLEALGALVDGDGNARACLRDARALVNQTLGELRELAQRLRPAVLEHLGYVEALRWYLGRLRERDGVAPSLEVEGSETRLPVAMEAALYRATEHALAAAAGAPGMGRLRVCYRHDPAGVRIEIAGSAPKPVDLVVMQERLRPFGGAVQVRVSPDRPPVIEVQVPAPVSAPLD